MKFTIEGLDPTPYRRYFSISKAELAAENACLVTAQNASGYPCRSTLDNAATGERLLLINYEHLPDDTPYRASHAIFISEDARNPARFSNEIPTAIKNRVVSIRSFDKDHMMLDAELINGKDSAVAIERLFSNSSAEFLHIHYALRGCYAARVNRA